MMRDPMGPPGSDPGRVRLGIVGLGRVFRLGYLPWLGRYLRIHPHAELTALSDMKRDLGLKYARKFGCEYYPEPEDLLTSGKVDGVIINTPTWTHEELVVRAADAGIHVLCEKPMAATVEACDRMIAACGRSGALLFISFMRRFNPAFRKIRELVKSGEIGELVELEATWPYFIPDIDQAPYKEAIGFIRRAFGVDIPERYGAWRLKDPRSGGGDFLDHGPHIIDFFRWIAGDIDRVSGDSRVMVLGRNEDYTRCVLKFKSGATGYITTTLYDFKSGLVGRIHGFVRGTRGRIDFVLPNVDRFKSARYLRLYKEPGSRAGKIGRALGLFKGRKIRLPRNREFRDQLDCFVSAIREAQGVGLRPGAGGPAARGEDGRTAIRVVEFCYRSSRSAGTWLEAG